MEARWAWRNSCSFFRNILEFGLKDMGAEQVWLVQRVAIGMTLYFQLDELMDHMFCLEFLYNKLSVGYVNKASYVQKVLESRTSKEPVQTQAMFRPVYLKRSCIPMH